MTHTFHAHLWVPDTLQKPGTIRAGVWNRCPSKDLQVPGKTLDDILKAAEEQIKNMGMEDVAVNAATKRAFGGDSEGRSYIWQLWAQGVLEE